MDKQMKMKRIQLLDEIHKLNKKCICSDRKIFKDCQSCKRIAELGQKLLKLTKPKKKNTLANHDYPDKRMSKRLWTSEMIDYIKENSSTHTCKEMAEYLDIEPQQVRSKCKKMGIKYKRDVNVYEYYVDDKLVATGSLPEISKKAGIGATTLHCYSKNKNVPNGRKLIKVEG